MNPEYEIVDAHQHIGDMSHVLSAGQLAFGPELTFEEDISHRIADMNARGISWAVLQPNHGDLKPNGIDDTIQVNNTMAKYKRHEPSRFRGVFGVLQPAHLRWRSASGVFERMIVSLVERGAKRRQNVS